MRFQGIENEIPVQGIKSLLEINLEHATLGDFFPVVP